MISKRHIRHCYIIKPMKINEEEKNVLLNFYFSMNIYTLKIRFFFQSIKLNEKKEIYNHSTGHYFSQFFLTQVFSGIYLYLFTQYKTDSRWPSLVSNVFAFVYFCKVPCRWKLSYHLIKQMTTMNRIQQKSILNYQENQHWFCFVVR